MARVRARVRYSIPTDRCALTIIVKSHLPVRILYSNLTLALTINSHANIVGLPVGLL